LTGTERATCKNLKPTDNGLDTKNENLGHCRAWSFLNIYDVEYVKTLPVYMEEGTYRIVADNGY
jgi:hypothetical protein